MKYRVSDVTFALTQGIKIPMLKIPRVGPLVIELKLMDNYDKKK